ncbi:Bifunctional PGK/TIM [Anaerohalosphaera lusitana]|uniref:Phosphoglycerate kinase n=1 Tax=Anaerohalosphaera lusitana TaxID=1936003 RepID=A0A1U9NI85_9BACT|nr:phosphoglycerate kinase [Anaerohalosphaera lusitana]AQT67639.1 Bifunctional PGK/TIM [Anaerohalosphaera lusitana]
MAKKTVADINVQGKKVLMRCDFNVPLDDNGNITNDARITKALPTIKHVLDGGGSLILMSHLGRPKGERNDKFSLAPVAKRLSELLGKDVVFAGDCIGEEVEQKAAGLKDGDVMLLENLRFHKEETIKDKAAKEDAELRKAKDDFAKQIAKLADAYVCDAFGTAHRDNASMYTVPCMMEDKPRVSGFLIEKEIKFLGDTVEAAEKPFVAILGGAKVSDKIGVIENLMRKVDTILIGGAMAYTFAKAKGNKIGKSLCEDDFVEKASTLVEEAKEVGCDILLPVDTVVAQEFKAHAENKVVEGDIEDDWEGVDIGPKTQELFADKLKNAKTIVWNGPMGVFELEPFDKGTKAVARAVADATSQGARSIIGGGDSASAVIGMGLEDKVSHVSTGGGASLEFLEGKKFKVFSILEDK